MEHLRVLAAYPDDCQPTQIEPLGSAGGFSGARFWRVTTPAGVLCLRRWSEEHPSEEGLQFLHSVLNHVTRWGCSVVPLPRLTRQRRRYLRYDGTLWELSPWMPGKADFRENPTPARLRAALVALAGFHRSAATFSLEGRSVGPAPGVLERLGRLQCWMAGEFAGLAARVKRAARSSLWDRAVKILELAPNVFPPVLSALERGSHLVVPIQPCIRDIWHGHILFEGEEVRGLIDFGSMRPDNVATDVARLLGSMVLDDHVQWEAGLTAYQSVRPLAREELELVVAYDLSTVVMSGLNWLDWIFHQGRRFEDQAAVIARLDEILVRLRHMAVQRVC